MSEESDDVGAILSEVIFRTRNLHEWAEFLTVMLPPVPADSLQIQQALTDTNNKYQIAFNCYNDVMVMASGEERKFEAAKSSAMAAKRNELLAANCKVPGKEVLESLAIDSSDRVKVLRHSFKTLELIMNFFENNKIKLEKSMQLVQAISYLVNSSDKMNHRGAIST